MSERPNDAEPESADATAVDAAHPADGADIDPPDTEAAGPVDVAGSGEPLAEANTVEDVAGTPTAPIRPMSPSERRAARAGLAHGQIPVDPSLRINDRASSIFVLLTVGVFAAILVNALVFGRGGLLTKNATPSPIPSLTAGPSTSPAPSGSAGPSSSPAPTVTVSPAPSPSPALSPSPAAS